MGSVWVAEHGWVYLTAASDCCTGEIVAWHLEVRCRAREATALIERAARELGVVPGTLTLGTDNGSALTAHAFKAVLPPSGSRNAVLKGVEARGLVRRDRRSDKMSLSRSPVIARTLPSRRIAALTPPSRAGVRGSRQVRRVGASRLCCRGLGHVSADQVRCALGDHDGRGVGVSAGDDGHDRGVHDAQVLESVDAESRVDHGVVAIVAHAACAGGVIDQHEAPAQVGFEIGALAPVESGLELREDDLAHGALCRDLACQLHAVDE
jgi:hypothetical protein